MPNWREYPFFRILLPFAAGIVLAFCVNDSIPLPDYLLISFTALLLLYSRIRGLYRYRWLYGLLLNLLLLSLGYQVSWRHQELNRADHFSKMLLFGAPGLFLGIVDEAPVQKEKWVKAELRVLATTADTSRALPASGHLLLYLPTDSLSTTLAYGDTLAFRGTASPVPPPLNPGAFDYRRYLHFQNIHHQAFSRSGDWMLSGHRKTFSLYGEAIALQQYFTVILKKHLGNTPEFAVGAALILGCRTEIPQEVLAAFSETGAMHVLAVSGLHAGIVFLMLNFFLRRINSVHPAWRFAKTGILLTAIWAYALLTGASPSVVRSVLMFSFATVGSALYRSKNFYNTLYASAFFLLCYEPFWLASLSFQLSYLAVFGIVYFQPKFAQLWIIENKILDYCWQLTCVSLGAQLATLPLTLFYFNQFPTYFWLSGLILVPLSGLELGLGLLLLLLENCWQPLALWAGSLLQFLLWIGNESVFLIRQLPAALIDNIRLNGTETFALYLSLLFAMLALSSRRGRWLLASLFLLLAVFSHDAFLKLRQQKARTLIVYHLNGHTALDFFDGRMAYSLHSNGLEKKALDFSAKGFRCSGNMVGIHSFSLTDTTVQAFKHWRRHGNFIQFFNTRLTILDHPPPEFPATAKKASVDYLLVCNTPKVSMAALMRLFHFKMIIFDGSNKSWQVARWKKDCQKNGIPFYDLRERGAFVADLNA